MGRISMHQKPKISQTLWTCPASFTFFFLFLTRFQLFYTRIGVEKKNTVFFYFHQKLYHILFITYCCTTPSPRFWDFNKGIQGQLYHLEKHVIISWALIALWLGNYGVLTWLKEMIYAKYGNVFMRWIWLEPKKVKRINCLLP